MMLRSYRIVAICAIGLLVSATGTEEPSAGSGLPFGVEMLEDSPAVLNPRENPLARSPAASFLFGIHVITQANVDSQGDNIVGDAANEPSIAVSPIDPDNMVIGWRQFDSIASNFRQGGWAYTVDGGMSWTFPGVLEVGVFRSDPVLDSDSQGNFYYQSLQTTFDVDVFKSTNGGVSWLNPVSAFGGDKNWMAIDRTGGFGEGHIYGIWQRFFSCCDLNVLTRSTDDGASFETPVPMDLSPTFGTMAVGPEGELYAAGIDGSVTQDLTTFVVSRSLDARFAVATPTSIAVQVDLGGSMGISAGPNPAGLLGQAVVATDHSTGTSRGNVYLMASVVPDAGVDPLDVHFARSIDGGQTWTAPIRVNDDTSSRNWQWFGTLSVAPNGRIDAIWNDTRNNEVSNLSRLYYSYSHDTGETWARNVPVTFTFNSLLGFPQQNKLGDYYTIVSDLIGANVAFAATFNGEQDVYHARILPDCNENLMHDALELSNGSTTDCNGNGIPDECDAAPSCVPSGAVPDGDTVPGMPLTVDHAVGDDIVLSWGASCSVDDVDYAIYEGLIGLFTAYAPRTCSTSGLTTYTLTPNPASAFYLVVPIADLEGSYGTNGADVERTPNPGACFPQLLGACAP
jgi:hypothetical protein